jgi:hypothetical protein
LIGPQHIPLFVRYFDGIDEQIARRLLRRVPPGEATLTDEFCSLMDIDNQRRESLLDYDADDLNEALFGLGGDLHFDLQIDTHQYTQAYEGYVSQADFGLVLQYNNHLFPERDWRVAYLMQAKRLMPAAGGTYDMSSSFASLNAAQQTRLARLSDVLGPNALRYFLYCPPTAGYEAQIQTLVRALHTSNLATLIYDYAVGLALHEHVALNGGISNGLWVTDITRPPSNAQTLHARAFSSARPLTWFFLQHFDRARRFTFDYDEPDLDDPAEPDQERRAYGIATGDETVIAEVLGELEKSDPRDGRRPETFKVLPANTVTIGVSSGPSDVPIKIDRDAPPAADF